MATCGTCGTAWQPGDVRCPTCGQARAGASGSAAARARPAFAPPEDRANPFQRVDAGQVVPVADGWGLTPPPPPPAPSAYWPVVAPPPMLDFSGVGEAPGSAGSDDADHELTTFDDDDGGLRVEALEHEGIDLHDDEPVLHVGDRGRWLRRVAVGVVLAVGAVAVSRTLIGGLDDPAMIVQTGAGSVRVTSDLSEVPERRWTFTVPDGATIGMVTQDSTTVYALLTLAGASGQQVSVLALDRTAGQTRWRYDVTGVDGLVQATPQGLLLNVYEGRSTTGSLLEPADGTVRWQVEGLVAPAPGHDDAVIVQQVSGRLAVGARIIAMSTGQVRWEPLGLLRTGLGLDVAVDAGCDVIRGRDLGDGAVRWSYPGVGEEAAAADLCPFGQVRLAVAGSHVVIADGADLVGLDAQGRESWRKPADGRTIAGSSGAFVLVQRRQAATDRAYLDAGDGTEVDLAAFALIRGRGRGSLLVARKGSTTVMLVDQGDAVVRVDDRTGAADSQPMAGTGPVGLGESTVYRVSADRSAVIGYALSSGRTRWTTPLDAAATGRDPVIWSGDDLLVVGDAAGPLTAYG